MRSFAWLGVAMLSILLGGIVDADARPVAQTKSATEAKRQAEAKALRKRLASGRTSERNFWRDVKRLEAIGPPDVKIAVVRHPGGTFLHSYKNIGGLAVAEDHVVLGPYDLVRAEQAALRGEGPSGAAFAVVTRERAHWWPNGVVPFEIAPELEAAAPGAVDRVIVEYEASTPVRFRPRNGEQSYVRFVKQLPFFASMADQIGTTGGENQVKIQTDGDDGALPVGVVERSLRHEIGHALGMYHEHNRKDRDEFVRVDDDCVDFWYRFGNFAIEQESKTLGPYDFDSIMHYSTGAGTKGPPWEPVPCFDIVKRAAFRAEGDTTGEIFPPGILSKHDVNALHHMYGRGGVDGRAADDYGTTLLVHNFDSHPRDDFPDLVVGAPGRANGRGSVFLYKGTANGFVLWKVLSPPNDQPDERFGESLAAGDFDGDGVQELAVGAPNAAVGGKAAAGKVYVFRIDGSRDQDHVETITKPADAGDIETQDRFGRALAAGLLRDQESPALTLRRRHQLAIGAPGARNGAQGRVGRVWVSDVALEPRFRDVRVPGDGAPKFGQFGYALTVMVDRPTPGTAPRDRLIVAAPAVTLGGCGSPSVYTTRLTPSGLETVRVLTEPGATPAPFCPQDPALSDAIDAFPNPFWEATFGRRMASGDFNGDGLADLAIAGIDRTHVFLVAPFTGRFELTKSISSRDFGDAAAEPSFGTGLAAGDLDADGFAELVVGAPLAAVGSVQRVGKAFVYKGCTPVSLDAAQRPILPPKVAGTPLELMKRFCLGGLKPWFTSTQTDFQSQSLTMPSGGLVGTPAQKVPMFPPFTENVAGDRFGTALAIVPRPTATAVRLMISSPNKQLRESSTSGTVFQFTRSVTNDLPRFRNHMRSWTLTPSFTTRVDRD